MIKLDAKNRQIVGCLLEDCRQSNTQIAKKCKLSREVVAYRIKQLEEGGIIEGYTSDINFNNLGFIAYSLGLNLREYSPESLEELKRRERIVYIQETLGEFNLTCTIIIKDVTDLSEEYESITNIFKGNIIGINADIFIGDIDFSTGYFKDSAKTSNFLKQKTIAISDTDKKILAELVKNSRISVIDLHSNLKISVPTINSRLKDLEKKGVILSNRAIINFKKLGLHRYTLFLFANPDIDKKLIRFCESEKSIWDLGKYAGSFNYLIEILAEDNSEFETIVNKIKNTFRDYIVKSEIMIVTSEIKHSYYSNY